MKTKELNQIFIDYFLEKETQYAILINGEWGCGKTYYWKNELSKIAKKNKLKEIYISLNGISDIKQLEKSLFYKLIPLFGESDSKFLTTTFKLIGNAINKAGKHFIDTDINDLFKGIGIDTYSFENYIICFDDLERCQIPIVEVLGFINNFTEHKNLKTIILSDESKISRDKTYYNIKEKVIERTINFKPDIENIISQLIKKYKANNSDYYDFLIKYKKIISNFFIDYKVNNIRIIIFYLKLLKKIYPLISSIEQQYIFEIIFFSLIVSNEYKSGRFTSNDYDNPKGIQHIDIHFPNMFTKKTQMGNSIIDTNKDKKIKSFAEVFYDTYLTDRISDYVYYPSIYKFILSGFLDKNALKDEIKKRYPVILSDEVKNYRTLLNYKFRELSNDEFTKTVDKVKDYALKGKYNIYDYVSIAKFYYYFSDNNLIDLSINDINNFIESGLMISKKKKLINDNIFSNLMHFGDNDKRVTKIKMKVKEIHNEIQKERDAKKAKDLIDIINQNNQTVLVEYFTENNFSKTIFKYLDISKLYEAIITASNRQIFDFTELLYNRYSSVNIGEFLYDDYEPLMELKKLIKNGMQNFDNSLQKFLLTELYSKLDEICNKLNKTRK